MTGRISLLNTNGPFSRTVAGWWCPSSSIMALYGDLRRFSVKFCPPCRVARWPNRRLVSNFQRLLKKTLLARCWSTVCSADFRPKQAQASHHRYDHTALKWRCNSYHWPLAGTVKVTRIFTARSQWKFTELIFSSSLRPSGPRYSLNRE